MGGGVAKPTKFNSSKSLAGTGQQKGGGKGQGKGQQAASYTYRVDEQQATPLYHHYTAELSFLVKLIPAQAMQSLLAWVLLLATGSTDVPFLEIFPPSANNEYQEANLVRRATAGALRGSTVQQYLTLKYTASF